MADVRSVRSYSTVEAREIKEGVKINVNVEKPKSAQMRTPSSAALIVNNGSRTSCNGNQVKYVYCGDSHFSASCERVSDREDRIEVLKKDRTCFACLKPGHRSNSCVKNCGRSHGSQYQSICRHTLPKRDDPKHEPQISTTTSHTAENPLVLHSTTTASSGTKNNILLQTATAVAKNEDGTRHTKVKILFDSENQRSYVADNLKSKLDLKSTKTEMLHLRWYVWREDITKKETRRADFSA